MSSSLTSVAMSLAVQGSFEERCSIATGTEEEDARGHHCHGSLERKPSRREEKVLQEEMPTAAEEDA